MAMTVADLPKKLLSGEWTSFSLTFNEHHSCYVMAQEAENRGEHGFKDWVSDEEREKALASDTVWMLQWYPSTPVGFYVVSASSLEALLAYVEGL